MQQITQLATYLFVGFIEMFLITQRTAFISRNKRKAAATVVLIENIITFFIIIQLAKDVTNNIPGFIAYCAGSCSGTIFDIENLTYDKIFRKMRRVSKIIKIKMRHVSMSHALTPANTRFLDQDQSELKGNRL